MPLSIICRHCELEDEVELPHSRKAADLILARRFWRDRPVPPRIFWPVKHQFPGEADAVTEFSV